MATFTNAVSTLVSGVWNAFEGVLGFLVGNIAVLAVVGLAVGGYVVYQNRRGGTVGVPGTSKKVN